MRRSARFSAATGFWVSWVRAAWAWSWSPTERALDILVRKLGKDASPTGFARLVVGAAMVDLERHHGAIRLLRDALDVLKPEDPDRAKAQFHLARALAATGKPAEARPLAREARQHLERTGRKQDVALLDAWSARALHR